MHRILVAPIILALSAVIGLPAQAQVGRDNILQLEAIAAIVNDAPISYTDVRQRARMLLLSLGGQQPTQEQIDQITAQALDQLIDEKLQLQEAAEYEVEISDNEIAGSIESLARQSGITREALLGTLAQAGVNPSSLEEQTRADIAWRRIMGGLYGSRIRISDNQIKEQLNRLKSASEKEQYQLAEIFLYAPDAAQRNQAVTAAQSIRQQVVAGAPFELAAQRFSSAPTAATGGDMGWVTLDSLDSDRQAVVATMPAPALSEPIVAENGVYLMLVRGKREPKERTAVVDLVRLATLNKSEEDLWEAAQDIDRCGDIDQTVLRNDNLYAIEVKARPVTAMGPEGQALIAATELDSHTEVFESAGSPAVMFVCNRMDDIADMPTAAQIEDRLYSEQLGMISERSLRNLRREATIIRN